MIGLREHYASRPGWRLRCCTHGSIVLSIRTCFACVRASVRATLWGGGVGGSHPGFAFSCCVTQLTTRGTHHPPSVCMMHFGVPCHPPPPSIIRRPPFLAFRTRSGDSGRPLQLLSQQQAATLQGLHLCRTAATDPGPPGAVHARAQPAHWHDQAQLLAPPVAPRRGGVSGACACAYRRPLGGGSCAVMCCH